MYGRSGLERFKRAEAAEPFKVTAAGSASALPLPPPQQQEARALTGPSLATAGAAPSQTSAPAAAPVRAAAAHPQATAVGTGASTWQPPDWAVQPRQGLIELEVLKDGATVDRILLDRKRTLFGRQAAACDIVLDHPSLSRQHAAIVHHKSGSVFVVDLGSAHGTVVAGERLKKDVPTELEVGQSLRFAASSRTYVLRKNKPPPATIVRRPAAPEALPAPPDPADADAVLAYNTALNRLGAAEAQQEGEGTGPAGGDWHGAGAAQRPASRAARRDGHVSFRDEVGGQLEDLVGYSDGAGCLDGAEPGPVGLPEGSALTGKFDSLVQTLLIPRGKGGAQAEPESKPPASSQGITNELKRYLDRVKSGRGLYGGLPESGHAGGSFPGSHPSSGTREAQEGERAAATGGSDSSNGWRDATEEERGPRKRHKQEDGLLTGDAAVSDIFVESHVVR